MYVATQVTQGVAYALWNTVQSMSSKAIFRGPRNVANGIVCGAIPFPGELILYLGLF